MRKKTLHKIILIFFGVILITSACFIRYYQITLWPLHADLDNLYHLKRQEINGLEKSITELEDFIQPLQAKRNFWIVSGSVAFLLSLNSGFQLYRKRKSAAISSLLDPIGNQP